MLWPRGGRDEQRGEALAMQSLTDGLKGRPLGARGKWRSKPGARETLVAVQQRDTIKVDAPTPQVSRQRVDRRDARPGQRAIPLRPCRAGFVGEVPSLDQAAALPAPVRRMRRLMQRVRAVRDMPHEHIADRAGIDIESGHLTPRLVHARAYETGVPSSEATSRETRRYWPARMTSTGRRSSRRAIGLSNQTGMNVASMTYARRSTSAMSSSARVACTPDGVRDPRSQRRALLGSPPVAAAR